MNHQETWPYGLRDFTLGVVSSWDLDDEMDSKSYEDMPQKYGGSFDQAVERARQLGAASWTVLYLAAKQLDVIGPEEYGTERLRRAFGKSAPLESPDAETLINLSAAFAKAESGPDRKVAGSISKPRAPAGFAGGSPFSICSE